MSTFFLAAGFIILLSACGRRAYLDFTGRWVPIEGYVFGAIVGFIGALLILIGILLAAAP
ncbi:MULTISPECIES: hypothetical protein [unclassified Mesorhizobium]|uniref:hypothetical protein n=1 Tax=unclassified Mesorhizobium TaxID=325217 RepID=UPI000BAEC8BB|nr:MULTISPECIES: hypothetical protein [unclassified Mesorhizobium]MDG4853883.1 hypothetical protein [Mesorhizobium sp. WSM4982]MDG4915728.1 hypothetical protein [Mesorhizobium sp. WSM4983]PBB29741.1 hypothetical protein CK214_23500 [Mesorhizobium sp. WSM3882]RWH31580.1 MAG: hypothetical protein EOQ76_07120 [Mesorhizobium sp.]RWH38043.1 MAG: hypothetical protein EOQ79_12610 [Mesorhizobium sp.]